MGTSATVRLIEGVRLIRCLLNTGFTVTPKRVKTTNVRSKNNPIFGVILSPDWESKELFFRSKNDPKVGVKLGVKVTP